MRVLCVDPGEKRIGLAISDPNGVVARPLTILDHVSRDEDAREIVALAESMEVGLIVVGVPYDLGIEIGPAARRALRLAEAIRNITPIPVATWDESGSTQRVQALLREMGHSRKKRREPLDHRAAAIILQDFLDTQATLKKDLSGKGSSKQGDQFV